MDCIFLGAPNVWPEGTGNRRANADSVGLKALHLDWMEQSVVPLKMVFQVWRSYSGKRQSATYRPASAGSAFECLVEAQECLAEF
jgi:hypothetical protein